MLLLLVIVAGAVTARFAWRRRAVQSATGIDLGRLPDGVARTDLDVVLITLDTTRADRLSAYGWPQPTTPALDRLAREGVLFEHAVAPAPLTLPSHASLFTAKYPPHHGVRDNGGFFLDERETTLAERLKARGFATGGFIGAYVLDRRWGIAQGFDTYFDDFDLSKYKAATLASVERPGNEVADRALAWLGTVASKRFFAWIHFYDAHSPYAPPEPYRTRFRGHPYLGEIAFVDAQVARIVAFLEQQDLLKKTIVVVVGDHGEGLGQHGESTHGFFIYEPTLHVPLIIRAPFARLRNRRVKDTVRSVDVVPTVLDLLGVRPPDQVDGTSVVAMMTGARFEMGLAAYSESMYPRYHYGWSDLRALTVGRFKFIEAPRPELYDLENDPDERNNLYDSRRKIADGMANDLHRIDRPGATASKPAVEVDPDVRARLASLGYVSTFVEAPAHLGAALPDPKDKIDLFNLMIDAREMIEDRKDPAAGLAALQKVVAKDPRVIDAWLMMGNEYGRQRRFTEAIDCYKRALALKPDYDLAASNLANAYRALGRDDDAALGYRQLLERDPRNAAARYGLAQILLDQDKLAEAETQLNEALAIEPALAAARNSLGALRLKQGRTDDGEREIRAALAEHPDLRLAHFNLALVQEQRGNLQAAAAEYRTEIERFPETSYKAAFNLGKLYEHMGDRAAQADAFRQAIAMNPSFAEGHLFLAKLYLDMGERLDDAARLAKRGLALSPAGAYAPLGHYVLADVYAREGRQREANAELARGRALEARARR